MKTSTYYFKTFTRNGKRYYLIPNNYRAKSAFLEVLTGKQNKNKCFLNVAFVPYRGNKYPNCIYVVEG